MGTVAVVTGAASGIGRAAAARLARDVAVVGLDRDSEGLAELARSLGPSFRGVVGDVCERAAHDRAAAAASALGDLRAWVNVAGIWIPTRAHHLDLDAARRVLDVNLFGTLLGCSVACETWVAAGVQGAIVNVSSIESQVGFPAALAYDASKGAVDSITRQIAVEYGPVGIRCNAVRPGAVQTPMATGYLDDIEDEEAMVQSWRDLAPLGRVGKPEEIADVIAFLLSEEARFVSGALLPVDGGASARCFQYPPDSEIVAAFGAGSTPTNAAGTAAPTPTKEGIRE